VRALVVHWCVCVWGGVMLSNKGGVSAQQVSGPFVLAGGTGEGEEGVLHSERRRSSCLRGAIHVHSRRASHFKCTSLPIKTQTGRTLDVPQPLELRCHGCVVVRVEPVP